jgi:hypothetical protein
MIFSKEAKATQVERALETQRAALASLEADILAMNAALEKAVAKGEAGTKELDAVASANLKARALADLVAKLEDELKGAQEREAEAAAMAARRSWRARALKAEGEVKAALAAMRKAMADFLAAEERAESLMSELEGSAAKAGLAFRCPDVPTTLTGALRRAARANAARDSFSIESTTRELAETLDAYRRAVDRAAPEA